MNIDTSALQALVGRRITAVALHDDYRDSIAFHVDGERMAFNIGAGARLAAITGLQHIIGQTVRAVYPYELEPGDAGYRDEMTVTGGWRTCTAFAVEVDAKAPLRGHIAAVFALRGYERTGTRSVEFRPCSGAPDDWADVLEPRDYNFEACN